MLGSEDDVERSFGHLPLLGKLTPPWCGAVWLL